MNENCCVRAYRPSSNSLLTSFIMVEKSIRIFKFHLGRMNIENIPFDKQFEVIQQMELRLKQGNTTA